MRDRAYAKINLALDVFNVRENGYHDLNSIMIPINFFDELEINIANDNSYNCDKPFIRFNKKNSILKMIDVVKQRYDIDDHFYINLKKEVPMQAGLGGGTADAGSTLRILKKLYKLDLTEQDEREICVEVGADVLFNYYNKPAVVSGIGDYVEPFEIKKQYYVLIVKPRTGVSTKEAYQTLNMDICDHPDIDRLKQALMNGDDMYGLLGNSLEQPAVLLNGEIQEIKNILIQNGARNVLMSGSGSSVFVISESSYEIDQLALLVRNGPYYVRTTKTLGF